MTSRIRENWGLPPWPRRHLESLPLRSSTPTVAIVGAGLTGLSAAYHLALRNIDCVVLEAGAIGDGASGRTGGLVLEGTAHGILEGTANCVAGLKSLVEREAIDCDLQLPGCWLIEHQPAAGIYASLPWTDDGHPIRIAGTVPGGKVEPFALLAGLAQRAVARGAIIHEYARVDRLRVAGTPLLVAGGYEIQPQWVVIAANAWIADLVEPRQALSSALTFVCRTQPFDEATLSAIGLEAGIPFYTLDFPYLWGRTCGDRSVVFGAGLTHGTPDRLEQAAIDTGEPAAALFRLERRVRSLHPALADVRLTERWCGPVAFTQDMRPLIGYAPTSRNVLIAGGYAGHGVALSVWAGELMAAIIAGERQPPSWGDNIFD